ncbi:protein KRI1 [Geosmithia morbida]|uniref:Protein KRI1 n=1 Tax=Geosmithia morbida TaxID=1094350 RepID=A0A9P4YW55_9HYPO|nr:protein KRI1 [Geosmithia morbida]KAF4123115.1 protein KRI1 [Geosmithia morbida]
MAPADSKPSKRKLLDSDSDSESDNGGAPVATDSSFKVNEEYAKRFEHNKKREERQRHMNAPVEEKYKNDPRKVDNDDDDESSSEDETEDEDGFLATEDLDAQISATLQAIRTKDPRVYDKDVAFYKQEEADAAAAAAARDAKKKKEKPVYLKDYHRERFLRGDIGASDDEGDNAPPPPQTFAQEQDALQKSIVNEMHAAKADSDDSGSDSDDNFMKRKVKPAADAADVAEAVEGVHPSRAAAVSKPSKERKKVKLSEADIENADRDPETFLSNFLSARAWVPDEGTSAQWEAFESDDGESDSNDRRETFEQAYNLRFEDPEKSNEVLKSYARDFAAAKSVRREEKSSRKRRRDAEREKKEAEKAQRREEKARLRKLKLDEAQEKLAKVKQAAGSVGTKLTDAEWLQFLDDAWDDDAWEDEMKKRFGDEYYAIEEGEDAGSDDEDEDEDASGDDGDNNQKKKKKKKKKHPKKPTWDDDIDIKDIVPEFDESEVDPQLLDHVEEEDAEEEEEGRPTKKRKAGDHKRARMEAQKEARRERAKLEALVDSKLELSHHDTLTSSRSGGFRYRETEPESFGMTARDILLAPSDSHLNDYAGLKKLAPFRPAEKRQRDAQRLSKKKRLRKWRREVFGREYEHSGPTYGFEKFAEQEEQDHQHQQQHGDGRSHDRRNHSRKKVDGAGEDEESNIVGDVGGSRKKRKRSKSKKETDAV